MKHVIGIFGLIDASRKSLTSRLTKGKSFVLYPGGIAELFLSSPTKEAIFARKGFIRLALQTGADVMPIYLFGNTTVLRVFTHPALMAVSRALGASLTLFWGRWGLPLPLPDPLIYVRGKPMGMPKIEGEPTQQQIDEWHGKYVAEVQRLFETYKHLRPDFKGKTLVVSEK
jgi:2-acylglycerol O-acyltransferase 2